MLRYMIIGVLLSVFGFSAEYIVPPEYDNTILSNESGKRVLLTNNQATFSTQTRKLGGQKFNYMCTLYPKIICGANVQPEVVLSLSEISLRETSTNKLVHMFASDAFVEDGGVNWKLCAGAIGGTTWDISTIDSTTDASGVTTLRHRYIPNGDQKIYYFFSNNPTLDLRGSTASYMTLYVRQICK